MKVIIPADNNVIALIGQGTEKPRDDCHLSVFCLSNQIDDGTLLYNNLTKELVWISSTVESISDSDFIELCKFWFFVPNLMDEMQLSRQVTAFLQDVYAAQGPKYYTILPTTKCNANCFYCFEKKGPQKTMSPDIVQKVIAFIIRNCTSNPRCTFRWFGGEPLLESHTIDYICSQLQNCNTPITYSSEIVTNGLLFTPDMIEHSINLWHLKSIQITLDGCETTYNTTKAYNKSISTNAFHTVVNNIIAISRSKLFLTIRINVDNHNIQEIQTLLVLLADAIESKNRIYIDIRPLFEKDGYQPIERNESERDSLLLSISKLQDNAISLGFNRNLFLEKHCHVFSCTADNPNGIVIMPDGGLYRCEHYIGSSPVGSVDNPDSSMSAQLWNEPAPEYSSCKLCPLYPSCHRLAKCNEQILCTSAIQNKRIQDMVQRMICEYNSFLQ